jgi:DNA polymerase-4
MFAHQRHQASSLQCGKTFLHCSSAVLSDALTESNVTVEPKIERLGLDFDSFFATAEQHFNPALRDRPIVVVPLDTINTGCIAISREVKARGLKSNASIRDAQRFIPDMIFVVARHDVYVRLHRRII